MQVLDNAGGTDDSAEENMSLHWILSDSPKRRKAVLMLTQIYAFFPPLVILILISTAALSTQRLWFFNVTNDHNADSTFGSAWTPSLPSSGSHCGLGAPADLTAKEKVSPAEINPPISLGRKGCSPQVGLLSTLLPLLNNWLDKGKHSLSSSKRALGQKYISWPKAAVQIQMQTRCSSTGEEGWV